MRLPTNGQWKSANNSDLFGHVVRTKNINFDKEGYLTLAMKPEALYSTDSDGDFLRPIAIANDTANYYVVTTDGTSGMHSVTPTNTAISFAQITTSSAPTMFQGSDAINFLGDVHVSGTGTIVSYDTGTGWTERITGLDTSYPHPLCILEHRNEIVVGDKNLVKTYNTSYSLQNTLTLPTRYVVTSIRSKDNKLYIGTRTLEGDTAMMYIWNGTGTQASAFYPANAKWIYSMCEYKSSIAIITSEGQLRWFNGGGFDDLDNLPIYYASLSWVSSDATTGYGNVLNRGMQAVGDIIYINLKGDADDNDQLGYLNMPSGLWVYDPKVGLYHKGGYVAEKYLNLAISSVSSSILTFGSAHGAETGDACWASDATNITGLTTGRIYYVIKESSTQIKLALSPADAFNGDHITCSGTPSGDDIAFSNRAQVAGTFDCDPGPVFAFTKDDPSLFLGSELFYGGTSTDLDGNDVHSLMSLGLGRNVGSFITPKIYTANVKDTFQKIHTFIRGLNLDTDKVIIKYRTRERFGLPTPIRFAAGGKATWTDDSTFTIDTTLKDVKSAEVGDEVEIIAGAGAGYSGHITSINDSTSTYTYVIDEDIPTLVSGDLSEVYIDNWKKLGTITNTSNDIPDQLHSQTFNENLTGTWIQLKFELRGVGISINMLELINALNRPNA